MISKLMQINNNLPDNWLDTAWNGSTTSSPKLSPMFDSLTFELDSSKSDFENFWNDPSIHSSPLSSATPNGIQNEFDHMFDSQFDPIPSYHTRVDKECAEAFGWVLDQESIPTRTIDDLMKVRNEPSLAYQSALSSNLDENVLINSAQNTHLVDIIRTSPLKGVQAYMLCENYLKRQDKSNTDLTGSSVDCFNSLPQLPRQRFSDNSTPSKYCHICGRNGRYVALRACQYTTQSLCRKVVCAVCISRYDASHERELNISRKPWVCTHCRGACPKRARCVQYFRNNEKRRAKNIAKRKLNTNFAPPFLTKSLANGIRKQSSSQNRESTILSDNTR